MKYKTFRSIAIASGIVAVVGSGYMMCRPSPHRAEPTALPAQAKPVAARPVATKDYHAFLLSTLGQSASSAKLKDAIKGPVKVNVYAKDGVWSRAKVDLDRDEKWDEKWWLESGKVMREVSGADDESYGEGTVEGTVQGP